MWFRTAITVLTFLSAACGPNGGERAEPSPTARGDAAVQPAATPSLAPPPGDPEPSDAELDAPDLSAALRAAVLRGIVAPQGGGSTWVVDPFVLSWVVAAVEQGGDRWLTRYEAAGADGVQVEGWQVRVPPDSPLEALGLQDGDVVEKVAAVGASDIQRVAAAVARAENELSLTIYRVDVSFTLSYRLDPGLMWDRTRADLAGTENPPSRIGVLRDRLADATASGQEPADQPDAPPPPRAGGTTPRPGSAGGKALPPSTPSSKPSGGTPKPPGGTPKPSGSDSVSCTSASQCTVDKAYFDAMVASPSKVESQANIVPAIQNNVHSGYKLTSVKSGTAVHKLGFRSGDKITHVNGYDLTNDFEALALYAGLGSTKNFNVRYARGASTLTKNIHVR